MSNKEEKFEENNEKKDDKKSGRLPEEVINYFKRVEQVLVEDSFEDDEHKEAFVKNVFFEVEKDGMQLSRHPITSRVLEQIIPLLTPVQYETLTSLLETDAEMLCCDRFASHVVELFCKQITQHVSNDKVVESYLDFCKSIRKHVDIFLRDTYGSHVLSTLLQTLSGVQVPETICKSRVSRESKKVKKKKKGKKVNQQFQNNVNLKDGVTVTPVPELFEKAYKKFVKAIKDDDNFGELLCHHTASPVLQVLVITLHKVSTDKFVNMAQSIMAKAKLQLFDYHGDGEEEEDEDMIHKLPVVLTDQVGSHLFEVILQTADEKTFLDVLTRCLLRMIVSLSVHPIANFLVQTVLRTLQDKTKAEVLVKKLIKYTEDILAAGHMGCIVRIAEIIQRLQLKEYENKFIDVLIQALHIPQANDQVDLTFAKLMISMMTYDIFYKIENEATDEANLEGILLKNELINYHGACLLKSCLSFNTCTIVSKSFVNLTKEELVLVACHPSGSFAYESFLKNTSIKRKFKNSLCDRLAGKFSVLASDKFGSRVVDALWGNVGAESKDVIKNELLRNKAKLESDLYGRIVLCNCEITEKAKKMKEIKKRQEKKRKMFEEILPAPKMTTTKIDNVQPPVKKSKNKNDRQAKYREQLKALGISFGEDEQETSLTF